MFIVVVPILEAFRTGVAGRGSCMQFKQAPNPRHPESDVQRRLDTAARLGLAWMVVLSKPAVHFLRRKPVRVWQKARSVLE